MEAKSSWWSKDGLLVFIAEAAGKQCIKELRKKHGFKYGEGSAGRGLYSPSWDRQMGEWTDICPPGTFGYVRALAVNPQIVWSYCTQYLPQTEDRV